MYVAFISFFFYTYTCMLIVCQRVVLYLDLSKSCVSCCKRTLFITVYSEQGLEIPVFIGMGFGNNDPYTHVNLFDEYYTLGYSGIVS